MEATDFNKTTPELKKRVKETSRQNSHQTRTKDYEPCNNSAHNSANDTSTCNFSFLFMFFSTFFSWLFSWFGSIRGTLRRIGGGHTKIPGKPVSEEIKSDSILLFWEKPSENCDFFHIRYKPNNGHSAWKLVQTKGPENYLVIKGLMADTVYIFQARGVFQDEEGPYGHLSDDIKTKKSVATTLLHSCQRLSDEIPLKYLLPVKEKKSARNNVARTRQLVLGDESKLCTHEKTMMLVGATGSGKSTLVDGFINFILGVSFEDPFRFKIVTLEKEEQKNDNQALSQTEWITVYKIHPMEGSRLNYTVNIIDTPGFGDTRGIEHDNNIVGQIRQLFSSSDDHGVLCIDAICFIVKAPDARLTIVQKYIFSSIMSLFGKDVEKNICTLITFADGATPPVLASLLESKLPFGEKFIFNNSALFAKNESDSLQTLAPMFWNMGCTNFEDFFKCLESLPTKSLFLTKTVLNERENLKSILSNIRPHISVGLDKISDLTNQREFLIKFKNEISDNENFTYTATEHRQIQKDLPECHHVTNCLKCNRTCHDDCGIPDDADKSGCIAMNSSGYCTMCPKKCYWEEHKNARYCFTYIPVQVTLTYSEMKKRYEEAKGSKLTQKKIIQKMTKELQELNKDVMTMIDEMNRCKTKLSEIALRPDPLSTVEHLDLMISAETSEKELGYLDRIKALENMKQIISVDKDASKLSECIKDAMEENMSSDDESSVKEKKGKMKKFIKRSIDIFHNLWSK